MDSDNKRIAKNTVFLYIRMLLVMGVSLYTSRVVLNVLGIEDYGIHNVVGGIVSMFTFLTGIISAATSRFFAYEIGCNDNVKLNQYFKISLISFVIIAVIILLVAETLGLWFLKNKIVFSEERADAVFWVYQFSIFAFIIQMFTIPYNSLIIAREKMSVYAYVGIIEVVLKLLMAYLLTISVFDRLKSYAVLLFVVTIIVSFIYYCYCRIKFEESKFSFFWDKVMFKELFSYSVWILVGAFSGISRGQGLNILLNMFFGPIVNAAQGIASQVNSAINQLVNSFYTASRPQITKLYAVEDRKGMMDLVFNSSRLGYFLVLVFAVPILIETPAILKLWLETVPEHAILFTRLVIVTAMIDALSYPFQTAMSATGKIKWYQIITGGLMILTLPVAYVFLKLGYPPQVALYVSIFTALAAQISRIVFMKIQLNMSIISYCKDVLFRVLIVTLFAFLMQFFLCNLLILVDKMRLLFVLLTSVLNTVIFVFLFGITKAERRYIMNYIKNKR